MPSHWNAFQWRESIRRRCRRSIEAAVHSSPISLLVCRRYPAPASPSLPRATLRSRFRSTREVSDASLVSSLDAVVLAAKRAASHCHQDKRKLTAVMIPPSHNKLEGLPLLYFPKKTYSSFNDI
ncbi:hypothetical protein EJB05_05965, partial [Eragrostis curvula]